MNTPRGNAATEASLAVDGTRTADVTELQTRVISAAVLAPVAIAALVVGGLPFTAFVALVAIIGFWEWTTIVGARIAWMAFGVVYLALPAAGLILLRQAVPPVGWASILLLLTVVWATDIAAYFAGRTFGGPKLWPRVSPKKTWSGALGGLAAALIAGGAVAALTGAGGFWLGVVLAAPLSIAAQAGDLFESAVKRRFGVKDSGTIIPGHGGVLDRVDGLLGAAALALLLAALGLGGGVLVLPALPGSA
jgi:phosphatidate cytidylyltransferase